MLMSHNIKAGVQWHQGMLLEPQHFQHFSARCEHLVSLHASLNNPFYWGVVDLDIDEALIGEGKLVLNGVSAIFQDGTVASNHGMIDAMPLSFSFKSLLDSLDDKSLTIYLAICSDQENKDALLPFEQKDVKDVYNPDYAINMPQVMPRLLLLPETRMNKKYIGFPVATVIESEGAFKLSAYVGPHVRVVKDSSISNMVLGLCKKLREKAKILEDSFLCADLEAQMDIQYEIPHKIATLTSLVPYVETLVQSESAHPMTIYFALAQWVGNLISLNNTGMIPPALESYDHLDIIHCLNKAIGHINAVIDSVTSAYRAQIIRPVAGSFSINVANVADNDVIIVGLSPSVYHSQEDLKQWLMNAFMASNTQIERIILQRSHGAAREQVETYKPLKLIASKELMLFAITKDEHISDDTLILRGFSESEKEEQGPEYLIHYATLAATSQEADHHAKGHNKSGKG